MEFCEICQGISQRQWSVAPGRYEDEGEWIEHHKTYSNLCKSVSEGCKLCTILKHGLLNDMRESTSDWEGDDAETWQLEGDTKQGFHFWIVQDLTYPGDGGGIMCDRSLLNGFYYRRCFAPLRNPTIEPLGSPDPTEVDDVPGLGAFFQLRAPSVSAPKSLLGRSQGLRPSLSDARSWLHQCIVDHSECSQHAHDLPTRLLYIHSSDAEDVVRLVEPRGAIKHYAALSHCWGVFKPLLTTNESYERHKSCIQLRELPQTFKDAVTVAKSLGIEYLWIDSLCIIQDCIKDWEVECSRMASVYSGASVTIAALDATDSSEGFLHDYSSTKLNSCEFPYWNDIEDGIIMASLAYGPPDVQGITLEPPSRLSKRGWVLQERLLSRRVLSFGSNRLHWECSRFSCSDNLHYPYISSRLSHGAVEKRSIRSLVDLPTTFEYWCDIVSTYSECQLTKATDKLPALSGLAQAISEVVGNTYVAGLWENDMHVGLAWYQSYIDKRLLSNSTEEAPPGYRAPSWSWACSDSAFIFRSDVRNQHKDLMVVSASVARKGLGDFGELTHGTLCVQGRMNKGVVVLDTSGIYVHITSTLHDHDDTNTAIAALHFDSKQLVRRMKQGRVQNEVIGLLISYSNGVSPKWVGLALEEIDGNSEKRVFQRVGIIICHEEYKAGYGWFDNCERQSIEIV